MCFLDALELELIKVPVEYAMKTETAFWPSEKDRWFDFAISASMRNLDHLGWSCMIYLFQEVVVALL